MGKRRENHWILGTFGVLYPNFGQIILVLTCEIICIQFISIPFCFETTYWSLLIVVSKGMSIRLSSVYTNFRIFWISALQSLLVGNFVQLKLHTEQNIRRPRVLQRHGVLFCLDLHVWPCKPSISQPHTVGITIFSATLWGMPGVGVIIQSLSGMHIQAVNLGNFTWKKNTFETTTSVPSGNLIRQFSIEHYNPIARFHYQRVSKPSTFQLYI